MLFVAAVALGMLAVVSPLDAVAEDRLLSAHMLQHVVIGDLVPVLLLVSLRGPLLFFVVPPRLGLAWARIGPVPALALWAGSLAFWHVPAVYDYVLERPLVHDLEHVCFFVGGLLVWTQLVDPARRGALSLTGSLGYALVIVVAGQLLANTLVLTDHVLYPAYAGPRDRPFGLDARSDQDAAGFLMMIEQLATFGTFATIRLRAYVRQPLELREDGHPLAF